MSCMKPFYFFNVFFLFACVPLTMHSQDTAMVKRNEVGFDFANIFRNGITPTFIYRYHFTKAAFRLKVSPNFDVEFGKNDKNNTGIPSSIIAETRQNTSYGLTLGIGYERNLKVGKAWFYYGADLQYKDAWTLAFVQTKRTDLDSVGTITGTSKSESETNTRTTRIGPAGIVGARFFIHPRIAISLETGLGLYFRTYIQTKTGSGGEIKEQTKNRAMEFSWNTALLNLNWFF